MKNNYLNNGLKNGLKALAFLCVFGYTNMSAQTSATKVLTVAASATWPGYDHTAGVVKFTTDEITQDGATFKLQISVTAISGGAAAGISADANGWGPTNSTDTSVRASFDDIGDENATISSIEVVDFNGGTNSYDVSSISGLKFQSVDISFANNASDRVGIGANGGTVLELERLSASPYTIPFDGDFVNNAGTTFNLATPNATSFNISVLDNSNNQANRFAVGGITIAYTFTPITLGVNDFGTASKSGLIVSPNPAVDTVALNMTVKSAEIVAMTGRTVQTFNGETASLDVSGLVSGMYILKAINLEGQVFTAKIIK